MSPARFSVDHPITTVMATLAVVVLGAFSLWKLRVDLLPPVELPTVSVRTYYEGASPEVVERQVTQIVEEIVATVPGVEEISSETIEGESNVRVQFEWGTDIDTATAELRATLEDELSELPEEIDSPRLRKFDINTFPVVIIGVASDMDPVALTEFIEEEVRYRFGRLPGVAQVDLWGGFDREVRVEVDPARLRALEIPLGTILTALRDANLDRPAGTIESGRYEVTLRAPAEYEDLDQIRSTVVAVREGAPVTMGQVAQVHDTYRRLTEVERVNGQRGIRVAIRKQSSANTVEVASAVLEEIDRINADHPQVSVVPVINQGSFIERSIRNVARSVLYGGGLAVLVLLLFLRNLRSTLVIALAIPISVLATLAVLFLAGFTLNLMTLGGLALGVGLMVDNSIVVLENVFRHRDELGKAPAVAAVDGTSEVSQAIVASTVTTLVIFLPLVFVEGVTGILFRGLAAVVVFSLSCSLLVSLTVVPMLSSRLLRSADEAGEDGRWKRMGARAVESLDRGYRGILVGTLKRRGALLGGAALVFSASLLLAPLLGTELLPPSDEGEVMVKGEMEVGTKLSLVDRQTRLLESIVTPAVPEAVAVIAEADQNGEAELRLALSPARDRDRSNVAIAADLRRRLEGFVPGMEVRVRAPQGQFLLDRILGGSEGLTVEVRGYELETLAALSERVAKTIEGIDGITDVDVSREEGTPQRSLAIDRDKAASMGLSVRDVTDVIQTAIAGSEAGQYRARGNSHRILVQLRDAPSMSLDQVLDLVVMTPDGEGVALRNLIDARATRGPILIERLDQQRLARVTANVAGRDLGSVAAEVEAKLAELPKPPGFELRVAGAYEEQERAFDELVLTFVLALALVYMVLASQYESFRDPLLVMLSVPMAATGVLVTLFATGTTLNVQSAIGCIMLGGIVVNNAILLVDQAAQLVKEGASAEEAALEAGRRRLRPILMTSLTTIFGLLPLALGIGEGADAQAPLAIAVIGGLSVSALVTLLVVPAAFRLVEGHDPDGGEA